MRLLIFFTLLTLSLAGTVRAQTLPHYDGAPVGAGPVPMCLSGDGLSVYPCGSRSAAGDVTIATGGVAQTLFGGARPPTGYGVYNPSATDTCWTSDDATAASGGAGSIPIAPHGGYETPMMYRPLGPISVVCPTAGDELTAREW